MQPLSTRPGRRCALGLALALATAACSGDASTAAAALRLRLSAPDTALHVGRQVRLTVDAEDNLVNAKDTRWSSSNPAVASVSGAGVVAALARGTTTIAVEYQGARAEAGLTIVQPVAAVAVNPTAIVLRQTLSRQVAATPHDEVGTPLGDRPVEWSSSNPNVVSVSPAGVLTAVAPGTATVSAASEGQAGTAQVTVTYIPLASVTFLQSVVYLHVGENVTFAPWVLDSVGNAATVANRNPAWSSSAPGVAAVDANGVVSGRALGDATISVTAEGKTATTIARVAPSGESVPSVAPGGLALLPGQTGQLTATMRDGAGTAVPGVTWSWQSSQPAVATVSSSGLVTAVAAGTATVTASAEGKSASAAVTVSPVPVASVTIAPNGASVQQGRTVQLAATPRDAAGDALTGRSCAWTSSNTAVATVSGAGLVSGVATGSSSITATCEGRSAAVTVTVTPIPVAAVSVSLSSASVIAGQTVQATATTRDAGGNTLTGRAVVWTSSNTAAATVGTSGVVTGVAAGTSTITATSEGQSGSATVTVTAVTTPPPPPPGGTSLFAETFESGSFATWDDGYDPTNHRIVSDASAHGGTRYLEITYPAGNSGGGGWLTKFFGPGRDSVHFSYYVRFPSDWTGGSYLVGLYGSLTSNLWSGFGQAGVCTDGSQFTNHFFFVEGSGSPGAIRFYTYHMDMAQSGGCYGDTGERAGAATYYPPLTMSRGDWHRVELQVRLNTPGQADGWERLYVDGTLVGEWRNMRQRTTSNVKINALQISANTSGGAASATRTINIDDITVSELGATTGTGGGGTTTPAPVATVTVTPNPTSVQAGSTVQLSAATRDASGNTLTGRVVTWSSSNSAVATVSGGGLVTGVAAGSATITATSETRTGTAAVTITAPPPPPAPGTTAFANEPAGLTLLTDNRWDALGTGGWQHADRDSRSQITADATAPASPSNVLEMLYPQGYTGGGEPAIEEYDLGSGQQEVFFGAWVKFSPNWQGHTSGINKIANVMTNAGFGRTWIVLRAVGEQDTNGNLRDGPFFVDVAYCGQYGGYPGANRSLTPFTTGVWHKIEWQVRTGTGGLVRWWVDGVLTGEYTNLNCMGSRLDWVEIAPTFGGTGDTKQQNDYIRYDHVRISGG